MKFGNSLILFRVTASLRIRTSFIDVFLVQPLQHLITVLGNLLAVRRLLEIESVQNRGLVEVEELLLNVFSPFSLDLSCCPVDIQLSHTFNFLLSFILGW